MADADFEFALERAFAQSPALNDAPLFAVKVMDRLDRGWSARRLLIGAMGVAGGLVAAYQMVGAHALGEAHTLMTQADAYLAGRYGAYVPHQLSDVGLGLNTGTLFMLGALAVVAAGLGLARFIREI